MEIKPRMLVVGALGALVVAGVGFGVNSTAAAAPPASAVPASSSAADTQPSQAQQPKQGERPGQTDGAEPGEQGEGPDGPGPDAD